MKSKKPLSSKIPKIIILVITLIIVLLGGVLFVGAVSGWFADPKVAIGSEYYTSDPGFINLDSAAYKELIKSQKSFIIFVDQSGCTTADRLRGYVEDYMSTYHLNFYQMMFNDVKNSSLHSYIKYYPSIAIIDDGKVKYFLRADSDEDAAAYNNYDALKDWLNTKIQPVENF